MSVELLKSEPNYNYISDTYSWSFYDYFDLKQYQMCTGEVRYVLYKNLRNPEIILTSSSKELSESEFNDLEMVLVKKLWFFFNDETKRHQNILDTITKIAHDL